MNDLFLPDDLPDQIIAKVTPKARGERIKKETDAEGQLIYKIYVTAAPEDGKANSAVIRLLAKAMGVSKSRITIAQGSTSRLKRILIEH